MRGGVPPNMLAVDAALTSGAINTLVETTLLAAIPNFRFRVWGVSIARQQDQAFVLLVGFRFGAGTNLYVRGGISPEFPAWGFTIPGGMPGGANQPITIQHTANVATRAFRVSVIYTLEDAA